MTKTSQILLIIGILTLPRVSVGQFTVSNFDLDARPKVPDGFRVSMFAREPLVRQPCSMAFDARGRLYVGMGPQYRNPTPKTPGDSVVMVLDTDNDGTADATKVFATGFNAVQGLAWHGRDLWIANAPDLTVVRDLDGDDEADEYVRVYIDLGNLEHGLHGLNWAPDGKLYMSKGNSKGLNKPGRYAPKPFRDLWGMVAASGTPDFPEPKTFRKDEYQHTFHNPADDWGLDGGVLRCDDGGHNLEIISRGFRNPWDITFDSGFHWLGTDNDQTQGDRVFMPFPGAHFGWNHPWNSQWSDNGDAPTAPVSGPLFEGSGTGLVFYDVSQFPKNYRRVFFINDWLRKTTFVWRPTWDGAMLRPEGGTWEPFVEAGNSLYRPTDIEVGPDGALWVLGWSSGYGAVWKDGKLANEGRIFRISHKDAKPHVKDGRSIPLKDQSVADLIQEFAGALPIRKSNAQEELLRRRYNITRELMAELNSGRLTEAQETWSAWTLGRIGMTETSIDTYFVGLLDARSTASLNLKIQAIRVLAHRFRESDRRQMLPKALLVKLNDDEPRLRLAAVLAIREVRAKSLIPELLSLLAIEKDRTTYYAAWQTLRTLANGDELQSLLTEEKPGVRRAALLALLEDHALTESEVTALSKDSDSQTGSVAKQWLAKASAGGEAQIVKGPPLRSPIKIVVDPDAVAIARNANARSGNKYAAVGNGLRTGADVYTDRQYRFTRIPSKLEAADIIRTANADDNSRGNEWLSFELLLPARVYVGIDTRQKTPPQWVRENYQKTNLMVGTNDCTFRLYTRQYPTGKVALGGNTDDGGEGGKSNYIIALEPLPLTKRTQETVIADVIGAMRQSDATRGEVLFRHKGGAGCFKCHSLNKTKNGFGPYLGDIGRRAKPQHILQSVVKPSAVITEGFYRQVVVTESGKVHTGILLEESGLSVTLGLSTGDRLVIRKATIEERRTDKISAMPSIAETLSPQQVADIVAFLLTQKAPPTAVPNGRGQKVELKQLKGKVRVTIAGKLFTEYHFANCENPFLYPVIGPHGIGMTRNFPMKQVEGEAHDHPHHTSIWFGHDGMNGVDFWRTTAPGHGRVVQDEIVEMKSENGRAVLETTNRWMAPGDKLICNDRRRLTFRVLPAGRAIDWEITLQATTGDLTIGDTEEGTMGIRSHPNLRLENGNGVRTANGQALNSEGVRGKAVWGKRAAWIDYWGKVDGHEVGIALFNHPKNPRHPTWWHARPYGLFTANPFGIADFEGKKRETGDMTIPAGKSVTLRYRIVFHEHDPKRAGIVAEYKDYASNEN